MFIDHTIILYSMTNKQIPQSVRLEVWNTYIGDHVGKNKMFGV